MRSTTEERFWSRVNKNGPTTPYVDTPCWVWTGPRTTGGYGRASIYKQTLGAHRASWWLSSGAHPQGWVVCHKCDNPPCVRPDHLFLGTHGDNMRDYAKKAPIRYAAWAATHNTPEAVAAQLADVDRVRREVREWWAKQPPLFGPRKF